MTEPSRISAPAAPGFAAIRAGEWWDYKLIPIVTGYYATALLLGVPLAENWPSLLVLVIAIAACAAYVSLVNDLTDLESDRVAGKVNRMAAIDPRSRLPLLLSPIAVGLAVAFTWRDDPFLLGCYAGSWIAFSLYSLPPVRLKIRGLPGILADGSGAHLFPTLTAAALAYRDAGAGPDPAWLAALGAWAIGYGLRGILWHQLSDLAADRAAGIRTFAHRHPEGAAAIGHWVAFPLELAGLAVIVFRLAMPWPVIALGLYLMLVALRLYLWEMRAILVTPRPRYLILLHEYYDVFLPLSLLAAAAAWRAPADLVILAAHLLLFGRRPLQTLRDLRDLLVRPTWRRISGQKR